MNKLIGYIGIGLVILLMAEFGISVVKNQKDNVAKNKLEKGELVEGYVVDFETEKKLSDESYDKAAEATENEANERFIYTFHLCIGAKNYTCLTNLLSEDAKVQFQQRDSTKGSFEGVALYQLISEGQTITGINSEKIVTNDDSTTYIMNVHLLNKKYAENYMVEFSNNYITSFQKGSRNQ